MILNKTKPITFLIWEQLNPSEFFTTVRIANSSIIDNTVRQKLSSHTYCAYRTDGTVMGVYNEALIAQYDLMRLRMTKPAEFEEVR